MATDRGALSRLNANAVQSRLTMPFDLIAGGHRFDPITLVCVQCGMSRRRYDDTGQRCSGKPQSEAGEQQSMRAVALNALDAVAISLDRRSLTQEMVEAARRSVAAVLDQLLAP